ncbi:MAG TPA: hypothetical protein V6C65_32420 [Allocoleopsis sp.]
MTPYEIEQRQQEQWQQQEAIANERYCDGAADADQAQLPRYADADYLAGYIAAIKHRPRNSDGTISYPAPLLEWAKSCACDEF